MEKYTFLIFAGPVTYPDQLFEQNWEDSFIKSFSEEKYSVKQMFEMLSFEEKRLKVFRSF